MVKKSRSEEDQSDHKQHIETGREGDPSALGALETCLYGLGNDLEVLHLRLLTRYSDVLHEFSEHLVWSNAFELSFRLQHHAMPQHREHGALEVVGYQIVATIDGGIRLPYIKKVERGTRARSECQLRRLASGARQADSVLHQIGLHVEVGDHAARAGKHLARERLQRHRRRAGSVHSQDLLLLLFVRVRHQDLQQEAVELRLGKRIGAFEVHGILGSEDGEQRIQRMALAIEGDLALFHRFQQRSLGARWHAVDFVDQDEVTED